MTKDNTVHDHLQRLQIPQDLHRFHDAKGTMRVHNYTNGILAVSYGPRCLARSRAKGHRLGQPRPQPWPGKPTPHSDLRPGHRS